MPGAMAAKPSAISTEKLTCGVTCTVVARKSSNCSPSCIARVTVNRSGRSAASGTASAKSRGCMSVSGFDSVHSMRVTMLQHWQ